MATIDYLLQQCSVRVWGDGQDNQLRDAEAEVHGSE